ncbi:hypothetical protein [Microtetraspora fusca]|uniref:hypothetical protein n=1 Tax=Microtetraspora fusca TaxID=1997 RepID=UPI000A91F5EF|nr:hypothetical protein [Microtetraspora fusca]
MGGPAQWSRRWTWLRVPATPVERKLHDKPLWGTTEAAELLPRQVPRPELWERRRLGAG